MCWPGGRLRVPRGRALVCYLHATGGGGERRPGLTRWPGHRASAENVSVDMKHGLPGPRPGVEHQAVAVLADALGERHRIRVMLLGDDQDMDGSLRIGVTERYRPAAFEHPLGRELGRHDLAKHAVRHVRDRTGGRRSLRSRSWRLMLEHVREPPPIRGFRTYSWRQPL